jgi:hypothetical protein
MRRPLRILLPIRLVAALLAVPVPVSADTGASRLKRCPTPRGFTTGPFFADQVRARGVSCRTARAQVKRWGRTRDCVYPDGPRDRVCRAGRYRCVTRDVPGFEGGRATCKRGKRRAVGFRFGS